MDEFRPLIEQIAGDGASDMLKEAEQLSAVVSAFGGASAEGAPSFKSSAAPAGEGFPLAPVAGIADEGITYCLARYMASGN